jgi:hypothetical protein
MPSKANSAGQIALETVEDVARLGREFVDDALCRSKALRSRPRLASCGNP